MKTLLIGLLTFTSLTVFANKVECGNAKWSTHNVKVCGEVIEESQYTKTYRPKDNYQVDILGLASNRFCKALNNEKKLSIRSKRTHSGLQLTGNNYYISGMSKAVRVFTSITCEK